MNTTIRDTVNTALPREARGYSNYVAPVVEALETRERTISEGIINAAVEDGIEREDVEETLRNLGLTMPVAQPVSAGADSNLHALVARLTASVERLERIARNRGLM